MADSNLNPAPRNVSAINGAQGIDISGVGQYDDNTPLEDIAGSYTNVGKQLGQIVNQAAEHVGDIQTKLVGNDFGGTNPYMYNTYYEPGANEIQSDWRVSGTQKALEVGMERGKKAAEAAAEAAKKNYTDAVNNFNQAVANPTIATLDTSQLGEGNTVDEFIAANDFSGSRDEVMNRYINKGVIDQYGADWSNKDRWKKSANATIKHAGVSQDEYKSWSKEQQDAFWADPKNGTYFSNYFVEDEIKETMGDEALKKYRESYNSVADTINKIYDYYNGITKEIKLEPVKIIQRQYGDVNEKKQIQLQLESLPGMQGLDSDKAVYERASSDEWVNQNIRDDKREEFRKWLEQNRQEHTQDAPRGTTFGIMTGPIVGTTYYTIDRKALAEFAKDKLVEDAKSLYGANVNNTVNVITKEGEAQDTSLRNILGFDIDTLRWYKSMQEEHPETLNIIKNQIAQTYGETSTLEIADGNHYYLINGEYKKPEAGTVVLFAAPGVMDNDGNFINKDYETFVDCFKKLNNAAANYSEEEREKLQKTMQESWTKYYQSIYMLKIAESYTGGVMNEDMYHALMYRVDPEQYKDIKVGDKKVSDIVREWKEGADKDGHGTYVKLTQLLNRAFANNGYYYGLDQNGDLVQYNLKIGDTGVDTVGQIGEEGKENPYANMSPSDAMAIFSIVSTSLQEYQNGKNQDVNINPYFLDDDNVGWFQNFANSGLNMLSTMIDVPASLITMGVGAIGNLFVPEDKRIDPTELKGFSFKNALAALWPENWGKDEWNDLVSGVSAKELYGGTPAKGTLDYQVQFSNLQQQNLADAINPFLVEYWFGKEGDEKNIKRIGEGYTSRTKGLIDLGNASAFDIYGLNTMFANGTAFQESSAKLLGALVGGYVAGYLTTGYKVAATSAMNAVKSGANALANNLRTQILIHSINNTSNETIAQAMGGKILTQTLEQQAAKTSFGGTAALGSGSKAAITAAAETDKAVVLRGMTDVALRSGSGQLTEGFSTEFLEQSLGNAATGGALSSGVFTAEQAKMFAVAEQQAGKQMAQALAAETIGNATLSLGTGLPAEAFSAMNSATQRMFLKAYNAILNGSATAAGKINVQAFLQSLGTEGIKEAAVEVAKASTEAVARGMVWTNSDTFRVLAQLGWDGASTRMLLTEFMKDAAIDLVRDNLRNATNPYLTNEGWQRQTVEEYFTNPWTYAQNMLYSGVHFGLQRAGAQIKDAYYSKQYDRHLQAYAASGDNPDAQARELVKVNQYINKIQENSNKLMRSGVPYSKMKTSSEAINDDLNYIITKQYEKSGINPITGEMNKKFTSADEFNEYLKNQKLSTKDRINLANRGMVIETQNNYIMSRYELGGSDKAKLGNIKDWQVNLDMQDIEQKTLDKYYDEVLHMKGTPLDKQRKMYSLYTQEIMAKYGKTIPGLEASLGNYYGKYLSDLEVSLKKNPKAQWTLGYTSLAGMTTLSDDSGDVMFGASFGNNFNTVDRNAADVDKSRAYRDIKRQLLDAIKRGDTELKITRADGKEKTYHLNKDGLNYLKTITAYNNSNTVHKYYDPIFGDSVQTREHKDQVPFAEAAYRSKDTIISGTKIATQAAEADAKAAQEIIDNYTQIAYSRYKGTAEDAAMAKRHQDIVDANKVLNVSDSDRIYKLSQDRAAAERYVQELDAQKHGEMQRRYKEVIPMLAEIDGEIGKVEAQREYRQAVSNTKTAISMYLEGKLSSDNPVFTYKYGNNESIKITLDDETLGMISEAAKNGQQFSSDLTMAMLISKRNAVPKRAVSTHTEVSNGDYTQVIKDLEADTAKTGEDHTATIIKLRKEMKENNVVHQYPKSANGKKSSAVDYAYKQLAGTDLDTATTGFQINGKDQLVKYAADDYYYLPSAGQKANPRRAQIVEAATAPIYEFLTADGSKLSVQDERMVSYIVNAAEQNLRNIDTGEENLKITVGTLKREIMKASPDAEVWMAARKSGATERLANISKLGAQPEAMISELKTILASNSNMPLATRNKFLDTISLYELISENSSAIKANAFSMDEIVGNGDSETTRGDLLIGESNGLVSGSKNASKYEKAEMKRMVTAAGDILGRLSNPNSKYSSALLKKLSTERADSSKIAKAVKKDFRTLAYDHYTDAIKNPTPQNKAYTDAAFSWAKARYEADPRLNGTSDSDIKVNDVDCMNALGAANHEVMLSAYGDKDNHTYSEYMAAQNNVRDFDLDATNGMFSEQARDYIRLNNATYGQSVEQAEQGINRLINYFPNEKASLLKKQQEYNLEGKRIASQYASSAQLEGRIKAAAGATLEEYGLGTLKTSDINRAMRLAGRLKKAKAEQEALSHRPITESWFGHSSTSVEPADMRNIPWRRRFLPNGQEDTAATIQSFKQASAEMNGAVSVVDGFEPGVTLDDYKEIVAKARKDLTALYKEAGLAKGRKGRISTAEIDAFGDRIIESYSEIANANGSNIASNLISLNTTTRDNTENAFISAASQAYSDSARVTYDAQAEILDKRVKSINRRIKNAGKNAEATALLKQQLADTEAAIRKHQLLNSEAFARDGKTQFYTDKQILSSEFGRSDLNIKNVYKRSNWPAGLEIGEGNVLYTVNPAEDGVDILKSGSKDQVSSTKLKQYLLGKANEVRDRFGDYYDDFRIDSREYTDNGDGTYTISGKYGAGDMTLQEQEERQISRWENLNTTDIDAEKRAILELSTTPIYETYDEMIDLERYNQLLAQHAELSEELYDDETITTINALRKAAYDQYLQLTNALGKEYLDSLEASKEYQKAINKERKAYKIDDLDEQTIKSNLSREEYDKYIEAKETLFNVARFQMSSDSGIYHAKNGVIFAKDGYNPTGFVDTKIAKAILEGRAVASDDLSDEELAAELNSKENRKARKEMQKDINKNQNKGSIHYKNTEEYKAIRNSAMDKLSARYTLNNYIQFENQTRDMLTGMGLADEYKILMDKDYSDMMQRVAGKDGGIENDGVKAKFFDAMMNTANLNKTIQDWQLAGGFSNYNAATIAQIRGAIFNDPRMALEYLKVFTAAKNSNSTMAYVTESREFLYRFVAKTGAGEYVTDLNKAISTVPGEGDVGTINSLTNRILSHIDGTREIEGKNMISRGFGRIADDMNALFSDATFVNTLPLFKVRMLQINYDEAVRYLKKFKGFEKMAANDIDDAAMWMAYAKTTDFLEPRKTRGSSWETFTKNIANEEIRKAVASWTGAKREASLMDNASTVFFALRWKMTFGGRVLNGMTNTPGALIRKLKLRGADITDPDTLTMAGKQFMRSGNTMGVATMIALSSLAMMWNKSLGYDSVSWDDLNIIGPDGEFQVPNILLKFQTLGQFWLPNDVDENGNAIINPTKRMFGLDPFSSIFTMSNTVARTVDKLFNPNAYQKTPQRGIIFSGSSNDAINTVVNSSFFKAIGDELVGSNLLSPYKAMYEVIVDDTYFGNNIWEKRKLADGRENPNYDFFRNVVAGVAHIFNFDWMLSGGTNKWVKGFGSDKYENTGKIGTVAGSGVFQHEFVTAAINILNGEALEGIIEAGELPIKTKSISGSARTDFNIRVKNIITQYVQEYKDKVGQLSSVSAKDAEYAKLVQKCADVVADWSAKNQYVLGKDQELVAYVTKTLMAICAGEYNDNLDYVQNAYWKAHDIAKIEQSEDLFLNDSDLETFIAQGKTAAEFAEEKNRRSEAYNQAIDDEYQARIALKNAGIPDSWLEAYEDVYGSRSKSDFKSEMRAVNKQVFAEIHGVLEKQIGEFKNFKEMKKYYEAQIEAASTTKQKAKLANKYNDILTEAIAPYVHKYGAAILSDGYYNNQNLANSIAEYVILPADKYYYGKTPRASYLRDLFHVGYRDNSALPSDKEVYEKYTNALKKVHEGASATAAAMLDRLIRDYKDGRIYISDYDYSRIIRMKAQLNARSKQ